MSATISIAGTTVGRPGLGGMSLSAEGRPDAAAARAVVRRAVELGIDFIDTADVYCVDESGYGHNERLIADALREVGAVFGGDASVHGARRVVVATKGGMVRRRGRLVHDASPARLEAACAASLRALGVERIDLYQLHAPDPAVPFADSVGALARLREAGMIAAVGLSNVTPAQVEEAQAIVPIASVQNPFGPWDAGFRASPLLELCRREGIAFIAYSPLGGGGRARLLGESAALQAIGRRVGCSPAELVLAWLLHAAPNMMPIPGASRIATVESAARARTVPMDDDLARDVRRAFATLPGAESRLRWIAGGVLRRLRRLGDGHRGSGG